MANPPEVTQKQAHEMLSKGEADLYLDVRSTPEYLQGHPEAAWHVPLLEADPARGMAPNPDFLRVVKAVIPKDRRVVVGCQSGKRSEQAAALMMQEGYAHVWNVQGGFGGQRDPYGRKVTPSWPEQGLPVETGPGGDRGYSALLSRAT